MRAHRREANDCLFPQRNTHSFHNSDFAAQFAAAFRCYRICKGHLA
jgi:hypothetical protein